MKSETLFFSFEKKLPTWRQYLLDRCTTASNPFTKKFFFDHATTWGENNNHPNLSFDGFAEFKKNHNRHRRQALRDFYSQLWAKVDSSPLKMADYWGYFIEPFLWTAEQGRFKGYSKLKRKIYLDEARIKLPPFLKSVNLNPENVKQHLSLLLSLVVNTDFVEEVLLELEFLIVEKKLSKQQIFQFLLDYLSHHGFEYLGPLENQKPSVFRKTIAKGVVWHEAYATAKGAWFLKYSNNLAPKDILDFSVDSYLNGGYRAHNNPPHGTISHLIQTFIQIRFLAACGERDVKPGKALYDLRSLPAKGDVYFAPKMAFSPDNIAWNYFWRATNDNFENKPVFSNAHFVSFVLFMVAPNLSEINLLGTEH